jgi:hypothetical protein
MPRTKEDKGDAALRIADEFLDSIRKTTDPIYVGIDPGASGAIGLLCENYHAAFSIPTVEVNRGQVKTKSGKPAKTTVPVYSNILEVFTILNDLKPEDLRVCLEQPPPTLGPGKARAEVILARHYAIWPLYLASLGWSLEEVAPSKWKREMGLWGKSKEDGRQMAQKLFPRADLGGDDGDKAESLLIAEWKRRTDNGGK